MFSDNYPGGTLGNLNGFPFIQLSGDAGVGAKGGDNEETLRIAKLDDLAEVLPLARRRQPDTHAVVDFASEIRKELQNDVHTSRGSGGYVI